MFKSYYCKPHLLWTEPQSYSLMTYHTLYTIYLTLPIFSFLHIVQFCEDRALFLFSVFFVIYQELSYCLL